MLLMKSLGNFSGPKFTLRKLKPWKRISSSEDYYNFEWPTEQSANSMHLDVKLTAIEFNHLESSYYRQNVLEYVRCFYSDGNSSPAFH